MSDEQTIYIGPEDDLTSVRERLQRVESRHVTMVIPAQTQLRSHVAWKLLHARAREMGKDVVIVSSDPQVRSVAQAVKFKVAQSLEAQPSDPRQNSRPGRSAPGGRGRGISRKSLEGRSLGPRRSRQLERSSERWKSAPPSPLPLSPSPYIKPVSETFEPGQEELPSKHSQFDGSFEEQNRPVEESPARKFEAPYAYEGQSRPSIHSLPPQELDDDEADLLLEDYNQAQSIRRAAMQEQPRAQAKESEGNARLAASSRTPDEAKQSYTTPPLSPTVADAILSDPFAYFDDELPPPPRAEQRGAVTIDQLESGMHPIPETPVHGGPSTQPGIIVDGEIEDLGDMGSDDAFPPARQQEMEPDDEIDELTPPSLPAARRDRRSVPLQKSSKHPMPSRTPLEEDQDEYEAPDVEEQPTQIMPPRPVAQAPAQRLSRELTPVHSRAVRPASGIQEHPNQVKPASRSSQASQRPSRQATHSRASRRSYQERRRGARGGFLVVAGILLAFLLVGLLAFFVPSTDVTIAFAGRSYSHALTLVAVPKGPGVVGPRLEQATSASVPAQRLSRDFTQNGIGTATGQKLVDNQVATGSITFTNNGSANITIPSGTVLETQSDGIQFVTTAEAVVTPQGGGANPVDVPVQAQKPGTSGNVGAKTITILPDNSKSEIARASHLSSPDQVKLTFTNTDRMTGGGAGKATVVTQGDLDALKQKLQDALNTDIQNWLTQQKKSSQDVVGKPDLQSTLTDAPKVDQVVENNSFTANLHVTLTALLISGSDIQKASVDPLNVALQQEQNFKNYIVTADAAPSIQLQKLSTSGTGEHLTLNFTAQVNTTPSIKPENVQHLVLGKSATNARDEVLHSYQSYNVKEVQIFSTPSFVFWVTFWQPNIHVHLVPANS
jgi:hypothetical protein